MADLKYCPRCWLEVQESSCPHCGWWGDDNELLTEANNEFNIRREMVIVLNELAKLCRAEVQVQHLIIIGEATKFDLERVQRSTRASMHEIVNMVANITRQQ
jgi:hypothetical protein